MSTKEPSREKDKDKAKTHKLSLKGSSKLVAEFVSPRARPLSLSLCHFANVLRSVFLQFQYSIHTILYDSVADVFPAYRTCQLTAPSPSFQRGVYPAEDFTACVTHQVPPTSTPKLTRALAA